MVLHKKEKHATPHVCAMNTINLCNGTDHEKDQLHISKKSLMRKTGRVRFTTKTSRNKILIESSIVYGLNDGPKQLHYWVLKKNEIRIYESSSPGSNLLKVLFYYW